MGKRILLVWDRLGDYHRARAEALRQDDGVKAVYTADLGTQDTLYRWKSSDDPNHFLLSKKTVDKSDPFRLFRFLNILLFKGINTVGIAGYGRATYILFILFAKLLGKKVIVFAESWYGRRSALNRAKAQFLSWFTNGLFVSGKRAMDFYAKTLGLRYKRMAIGYSTVDNKHFSVKDNIRRDLIEYPHLLCIARFSREKNHERMIDAFLRSEAAKVFHLKLVGAGPQLTILQKRFNQRKEIIFADWAEYKDLPIVYQQASALILASSFEPWGLVVNEAMAARLPVLLSKQCGCVPELAQEANSMVFDAYRVQDMKRVFDEFSAIAYPDRLKMGKASEEIIKKFTPETWAKSFLKLLK